MDFLNLGSGEFVFLILLAILLVGPKRAVEWVQQATRFAARIRQEWLAVQRDVMKEVQVLTQETTSALQPALKEATREGQVLWQEVTKTIQPVHDVGREVASLREQVATQELLPLPDVLETTDDFAG